MTREIKKIVEQIFPFQRMINSQGMDEAFRIVKSHLPSLKMHEYFPGEEANDWTVPPGWELLNAYMKDSRGKIIASSDESFLFVAAYSEPVKGKFKKAEIAKHLRSHPTLKEAYFMEHRNAYNYKLVDWGITLPQNIWDLLSDTEDYEIVIEVRKDFDRSMKVGECYVQGKTDKIICFTAHIDELCNDNLSSCAVLIEFFKQLIKDTHNPSEYTYQLLLVPEVIGTFFYLYNNQEKQKKTVSMINLETVGCGERWLIKQSFKTDNYLDRIMEVVGRQVFSDFDIDNMFGGYGNEERVFEYPTIRIPSAALQRYPFNEYHSSFDTPEIISNQLLNQAFEFVETVVKVIELDFIPEYNLLLPPWLTKHDLYFDSKDQMELFNVFMNQIQFNVDGKSSLVDLSFRFNVPFKTLYEYLIQFVNKGFITKKPTHEIW
jgi:aminopeptidase-like protein